MIIFKNLNIQSFKSIFNTNINFNELDGNFFSLEGKNNTVDFAISNGSGKSTLFDALSYVLYGTTMGIYLKKEDYQNKFTKLPLKLVLDFDIDCGNNKGSYTIEKTLQSTLLFKDNENISELTKTETEKKIASIINLSKEEFFSFTYLTQTTGGNFLGKTASEKLAVIKDFIFGEELLNIKTKIDTLLKENKNKLSLCKNDLSKIEGEIISLTKIKNKNIIKENINEIDIEQDKKVLDDLVQRNKEKQEYIKQLSDYKKDYNNYVRQMSDLKTQILKVKDNICPTCGQTLHDDKVELDIKQKAKNIKSEATIIKNNIEIINNTLNNYGDDIEKQIIDLRKSINERQIALNTIKQKQYIESELAEQNGKQKQCEKEYEQINVKVQQINSLQKYFNTTFIQYVQQSFLSEIENYLNLYCYEMFNEPFSLKFSNNSLELFIGNKPYSYFSGGERQKIDFIFVFAIKVALANFTDKCTNLIIFDESLSGSDYLAFDNSIDLISRLSKSNNLITILISHRENSNISTNKIILERYSDHTKLSIIKEG